MNATRPPHIGSPQERAGKLVELQKLITEGLESGVSDRTIDDVLKAAREQAGLDKGKSRVG